jgi:hypothetical protein
MRLPNETSTILPHCQLLKKNINTSLSIALCTAPYYIQEPTCVPDQPQIPLTDAPAPLDALPKPIAPELSFAVLAPAEGPTYAWMWRMLRNM